MKTIRTKFVKEFGEDTASAIERAANGHENGINSGNKGKDPFKWAILICIGYECMESTGYKKYHGIKPAWKRLKKWIKENGELHTHDGDSDYISLLCGTYNQYMPKERP